MFKFIFTFIISIFSIFVSISSSFAKDYDNFLKSIAGTDEIYTVIDIYNEGYVIEMMNKNNELELFEFYSLSYIPAKNKIIATDFYGSDIKFLTWELGSVKISVADGELVARNDIAWNVISLDGERVPYVYYLSKI